MDHSEWAQRLPSEITADSLWKSESYRLALFAAELGWNDATCLTRDRRTVALAAQLNRALGSISANIAEGYSRSLGLDRARFYEYALGSARESRDWYYKARHVLGETEALGRITLLTSIIRLLLVALPNERRRSARTDRRPQRGEGI